MSAIKVAHLTRHEVHWVDALRALPEIDQEYLLEIAHQILLMRRAERPGNVILLSDPLRKFPKAAQA